MLSSNTMQELAMIHQESFIDREKIIPWSIEDVRFLALSLCGEAGELANMLKKEWRGDKVKSPFLDEKMHEEVADCAAYVFLLSHAFGIDLGSILERKLPAIREKLKAHA